MTVKIWGSRGSLPSPGADKIIYGGNTACVEITHGNQSIILDGGSGIIRLGESLSKDITHINILLTHVHLDHIIGLGFFNAMFNPEMTIKIWGPKAAHENLEQRLRRYFSPPIFPVRLHELPAKVEVFEIVENEFHVGAFRITAEYICHPGATVGYRVQTDDGVVTYIPDHEPALGSANYPNEPEWTSGYNLAKGAGILIHDAMFTAGDYSQRIGWGHCSMKDALDFATLTAVKKMLFFHHDPGHSDTQLEQLFTDITRNRNLNFEVQLAAEGKEYTLTA